MTVAVGCLTGPAMVAAWERAHALPQAARALVLLRGADLDGADDPEGWSVGRCDAFLLDLRAATFGKRIEATTTCPRCEDEVELDFDVDAIRAPYGDPAEHVELRLDGGADQVVFRVPTLADLAAAGRAPTAASAGRVLAERCLVAPEGGAVGGGRLTDEVVAAMGEAMAEHDPQSDVRLDVSCPLCGAGWACAFGIDDFLWREVAAEARRLLAEVHALAQAYGWSEADILALAAPRREAYLEMLDQ
jgi:hypothetical protein